METLEAIRTRRSIRRFQSQPVPEALIHQALRGAMSAPSAGNEQCWQFVVITERALLNEVPRFHPYAAMMVEAPVAILICGDLNREVHQGYWVQDCAAATQNLLLALHDQGLGAVWLGIYPRMDRVDGLRALLHLPDHIVPFALVPTGYKAEVKSAEDRFDAGKIHTNTW